MRRKKTNSKKKELIKTIEENYDNKEIIKQYAPSFPDCLLYIDQDLLLDRDFCKELLLKNGLLLKYMPKTIKKDKELVIIAIDKSAGFALKFADEELKKDISIVKHAILKYKAPLKYASEDLQKYFKNKWDEFFKNHPYQKWTGFNQEFNGIRNTKEEMNKIYEDENKKNDKNAKNSKKTDKANKELEVLKECLEEMQIKFNEYDFEEHD